MEKCSWMVEETNESNLPFVKAEPEDEVVEGATRIKKEVEDEVEKGATQIKKEVEDED